MITASVSAGSSLLLEPAHELLFPLPDVTSAHRPRCILTLTNLSVVHDVVFRIRTRNPEAFTVRPTHGLLSPDTSSRVIVTATASSCRRLGAMDPRDLMTHQSSELFLVQSVEREGEGQMKKPLDPNSSTSLRAFWKNLLGKDVSENKLVCCFVAVMPSALEVSSNSKMLSRSMSSASSSSLESRTSQNDKSKFSRSAREPRSSRSGSSSSKPNQSYSNQFTLSEKPREESRQHSFDSDANFRTTIEPPLRAARRSDARMLALPDDGLTRTPKTRLRDSALSSLTINGSSVSDTMLSARTASSTVTAATESMNKPGPLLYHIQPEDTLSFQVMPAPRFWGSTSCFIVNSSQNDCLTFKVRTSNQSGYVVKPSRGLVSTTNAQEVVISLCAPSREKRFDPKEREAKDGFMIEIANISRDKYDDLMKLDERKRFHEMNCLWAQLPRSDRQERTFSIKLNMENSYIGSSIPESSESEFQSEINIGRTKKAQGQLLKSVDQGVEELSMSLSTDKSEDKVNYKHTDESAVTIAPTSPGSHASRDSKILVVSADSIDTVDFSNPKLSFFI